jgi:uncharacterized protein YecE (DUF72 family)
MAFHVGTSGWSYDHWQGILYPPKTPSGRRLEYYLRRFDTVELNYSYYRWPQNATFTAWRERLPAGFLMTAKAPRGLTHFHRLRSPEAWLERIAGGVRLLGDRFGVLLVQLSPSMPCDLDRLQTFLERVPSWIRIAVEFRHPSWHREEVFQLLEDRAAAYCVMSGAGLPCLLRATAPFVYVRFHGPNPDHLYAGSYADDDLTWWAERFRAWQSQRRDVWAYFNNDWEGNAVRNAGRLLTLLGREGTRDGGE